MGKHGLVNHITRSRRHTKVSVVVFLCLNHTCISTTTQQKFSKSFLLSWTFQIYCCTSKMWKKLKLLTLQSPPSLVFLWLCNFHEAENPTTPLPYPSDSITKDTKINSWWNLEAKRSCHFRQVQCLHIKYLFQVMRVICSDICLVCLLGRQIEEVVLTD